MTILAEFHFIRPGWLALLPLVVGLWWLERRMSDSLRGWRTLMDPNLLAALTVDRNANTFETTPQPVVRNALASFPSRDAGLFVAWLLGVVAVAGPTWRPEPSPFADDPVPVMIVLKADESMNMGDLIPSRMERARLKVIDFAEARKGQPLGLIVYAGSSHLVLPPTRDTSVVATMAAEISPEIMPKSGDDLPSALGLAESVLGASGGSVVVVADSVDSSSQSALADFHQQSRLPVYIMAIAGRETPEMDTLQDAAAALGSGVTTLTPDSADIESLLRSVAKMPVSVSVADEGTRWAEAGWWLVPILALLVLASFRREYPIAAPEELS